MTMHVKTHRVRPGRLGRLAMGLLVVGLAAAIPGGVALGGGPSSPPPISTQGVVVYAQTNGAATDGTYAMTPTGTGITRVTTLKVPTDVSRGQFPVTILIQQGTHDFYAQRADGVGSPVLLLQSPANVSQPRFSPDGSRIAYVTVLSWAPDPYTATISTADVVRSPAGDVIGLANTQVVLSSSTPVTGGIDFSRDGTRIVFASDTPSSDLFVLDLSSGLVEQITNTPTMETHPRWSPVDDRIAFDRGDFGSTITSVLTIDYATRAVTTVVAGTTRLQASRPCWSPGATNLLAKVGGTKQAPGLYQFPSRGGSGVYVSGGASALPQSPCWGW